MIAVLVCDEEALHEQAVVLADTLGLALYSLPVADSQFYLCLSTRGLALHAPAALRLSPWQVDFAHGAIAYRLRRSHRRNELIAKAVGIKPGVQLKVVDATAGWGRDGYCLASLGCDVTMLERHPIVAALLADGLSRAEKINKPIQCQLYNLDASVYFATAAPVDVVLLDPMYPDENRSALAQKSMQMIRGLVGDDGDGAQLLPIAKHAALKRVVVKRTASAPSLGGGEPDWVYQGKSTRFDVYAGLAKLK